MINDCKWNGALCICKLYWKNFHRKSNRTTPNLQVQNKRDKLIQKFYSKFIVIYFPLFFLQIRVILQVTKVMQSTLPNHHGLGALKFITLIIHYKYISSMDKKLSIYKLKRTNQCVGFSFNKRLHLKWIQHCFESFLRCWPLLVRSTSDKQYDCVSFCCCFCKIMWTSQSIWCLKNILVILSRKDNSM